MITHIPNYDKRLKKERLPEHYQTASLLSGNTAYVR